MNSRRQKLLRYVIGIAVIAAGILLRVYFTSLAPTTVFWDMETHHGYAETILERFWASDCCTKNLGYSAFLAVVYFFTGRSNLPAVQIFQITAELFSAVLVYAVVLRISGRLAAFISFCLFLMNPFTAAFTGYRLPEVMTVFYVMCSAFIISRPGFTGNRFLWYAFGLTLGLLVFTRQQFYYFAFGITGVMAALVFRHPGRLVFPVITAAGFFSVMWYPLAAGYFVFGQMRMTPQYADVWGSGLYGNFYRVTRYPEVRGSSFLTPEFAALDYENHTTPLSEKKALQKKYRTLFFERIRHDWPLFLRNTFRNMIWLWDKEHLFQYEDPFYPGDRWPVRTANAVLLAFSLAGLVRFALRKPGAGVYLPVFIYSISLAGYITLMFPLVSNESRHTIAVYGLVAVWAGYGIDRLLRHSRERPEPGAI